MPAATFADVNVDALDFGRGGIPDGACVNYERCGNVPPGKNQMCASCVDDVRHK